jgi:alpha-1,6-mannosyltransferase
MIKTLHLTNAWHSTSGGIATFYRALLAAANEQGHFIRLVAPAESERVEEAGRYGLIYFVKSPRAPLNSNYRIMLPDAFLGPGAAIGRILDEERPDLVEVCDKYTLPYLAGLLRERWLLGSDFRPVTVGLSCERMDENFATYIAEGAIGEFFSRVYMKWLYFPMFGHHITVSEHTAEELIPASRGHKVRRGVWVSPMGVDCDRFRPERRTAQLRQTLIARSGGAEGTTLMLYAGRLAAEKNLPLLVSLMESLATGLGHDYRLLIAGDGVMRAGLERLCEQRSPGRVTFLGHLGDRDQLADVYANADIFVHPNPREPFGIAPLEAMAAGLALVATRSGGVVSYATDENAWLGEANAEIFAGLVRSIVAEPERRCRKTHAARATAEQYRWQTVAARYLSLYESLCALGRGTPEPQMMAPRFYSTAGNQLGFEIRPATQPSPQRKTIFQHLFY